MLKHFGVVAVLAGLVSHSSMAFAGPDAGSYLAGKQALVDNDFQYGAKYFSQGLVSDPTNGYLLESALTSYIALGQMHRAGSFAEKIVEHGFQSQMAHLVLFSNAAADGEWSEIFGNLERGRGVAPLVDGLAQGWAHLGQGDTDRALTSFDQVIEGEGMALYGLTHKAYALATVGDFDGAQAAYLEAAERGILSYSVRRATAHVQILSQLGRNDDAIALIEQIFGKQLDPRIQTLKSALEAGEAVPFSTVRNARQGIGEIFHDVADAVRGDAPDEYTLLYARAANYLNPGDSQAMLLTAALLDSLGQYQLSNDTYASVSRNDPAFHAAELGRAQVLSAAGRDEAAIEVLEALARSHPDLPQAHASKGDTLRQTDRFEEAAEAYSRALRLYDDASAGKWFVYYTRGIAFHKMDDWDKAEADFRAALALRPDHPQILNYLGYSLVERGEKLDEALGMIETAAEARPENGAIMDSLGWVYFQLGRYEEAVEYMEIAASLKPVDPVINDHLGDVYWAVGRKTEAHFQWQRALSFDPGEEDAQRIRDKLSRGLDLVRVDEGLEPIQVASDH